jgi:hypothetical protein
LTESCHKGDDLLGKPIWSIYVDVVTGSRNGYEAPVRKARAKVPPCINGNGFVQGTVNL